MKSVFFLTLSAPCRFFSIFGDFGPPERVPKSSKNWKNGCRNLVCFSGGSRSLLFTVPEAKMVPEVEQNVSRIRRGRRSGAFVRTCWIYCACHADQGFGHVQKAIKIEKFDKKPVRTRSLQTEGFQTSLFIDFGRFWSLFGGQKRLPIIFPMDGILTNFWTPQKNKKSDF